LLVDEIKTFGGENPLFGGEKCEKMLVKSVLLLVNSMMFWCKIMTNLHDCWQKQHL